MRYGQLARLPAPVSIPRKPTVADVSSMAASSTEVRLMMRIRGWAAACSNRIGSRNIWVVWVGRAGAGRRPRGWPAAVRPILHGEAIAAAGNFDPRQLRARESGAIADVVRIVRRQ